MNDDFDDTLLDDDDETDSDLDVEDLLTPDTSLDARRLIERRIELLKLRKLLDDPSLEYEFD